MTTLSIKVTEDEARARLVAHFAARQGNYFYGDLNLSAIVGDSFLFSESRKATIDLRGYYVDGRTGAVSFRNYPESARFVRPPFGAQFDHHER